MDADLRGLQRLAATGDHEAEAALQARLDRLAAFAVLFRGPRVLPKPAPRVPRRDTCPRIHNEKLSVPRHRVLCASSADAIERRVEKRVRRAAKFACDEGLADYYEDREPFSLPSE